MYARYTRDMGFNHTFFARYAKYIQRAKLEAVGPIGSESILFGLQDQLKGRMASDGPNKLSIDNN